MLELLIYTWYAESVQSVAQWSINGEIIDNFLLFRKIMLHSMTSESVTCVVCSTKGKCYVKRLWFFHYIKKIKNKNVYLLASKNAPPPKKKKNYYLFLHSMIQPWYDCSVLSTLAKKERLKLCKKSRVVNCHLISFPIPLNNYTE